MIPPPIRTTMGRVALFLLLVPGCARHSGPRVEEWKNGAYQPISVVAYTIEGRRDGDTTQALATFTLATGQHLRIVFDVVYNPTPALGDSRWSIDGENANRGAVRAESVRFLGGQGEGPSLGGRFLLEGDDAPLFRVVLPMRHISRTDWNR